MAVASCLALLLPIEATQNTRMIYGGNSYKLGILRINDFFHSSSTARCYYLKMRAAPSNQNPKSKSVICTGCDGNGSGVNYVDFFDGTFKAGDSCWLYGGKKDMLCGNYNGAGFIGGFISTFDE